MSAAKVHVSNVSSIVRGTMGGFSMPNAAALEALQSTEQRQVLDTVSELLVCGDQSAGKSSVLEALTEIPFPRKDNLCTRFPTEIILRRGTTESLKISIIPDRRRSAEERAAMDNFSETILDLQNLPEIMSKAMSTMGLEESQDLNGARRAFAMDVLVLEIEGPARPQLTVVDLPGIIQAETRDATQADVQLSVEITKSYISSPRTICLAVISAANDYANQPILNLVRQYDPKGERTLGIITKPDRLPPGSETELSFLNLANNRDIMFDLGWHVLKNRSFEEMACSILERNASEEQYFRESIFSQLGSDRVGILALAVRLSRLAFDHCRQELPRLQTDLEGALSRAKSEMAVLGSARTTAGECRNFLTQLSLNFHEICKAAISGYYEGEYFKCDEQQSIPTNSPESTRRLRAIVQSRNMAFSNEIRTNGHKFHIVSSGVNDSRFDRIEHQTAHENEQYVGETSSETPRPAEKLGAFGHIQPPTRVSHDEAIRWVNDAVAKARGKELPGNFNPLVIAELFWEQSSKWHLFAFAHIVQITGLCCSFLECLLSIQCPRDIHIRLWPTIHDQMTTRRTLAIEEMEKILEEMSSYPINYNHYYTDTIKKRQIERRKVELESCLEDATHHMNVPGCSSDHTYPSVNVNLAMKIYSEKMDPDMDKHSAELVLDCLQAIYKVCEKVFVANIAVQVIERHIIRGLEHIFSPVKVSQLLDTEALALAAEPDSTKTEREALAEKVRMFTNGKMILNELMSVL
ncbi:P-loop containing nucleoside triphosphate hydrolase protein [Penicillium diatomitis]|uniref:P-loop containing nucleoside triphosphate hydrolase protein n=1 Tax=Penicillium diatomitis TaxID=2819901 RepID=A0A9X0BM08_9EURO|nr:P-loop containing nucleoside triphosphate hydrolase protein [Penicillium diatomitis]KAJ5471832.1 P-loop containing nucleoside triphosphate hydrolase protein [Penicillium diatomitis]